MPELPEIIDEEDVIDPISVEESNALSEKFAVLKDRCDAAKIEFVQDKDEDGDLYARISFQSGRYKRNITIYNERSVDVLISVEFENYKFLSGYEAIYNYKDAFIEVGLTATRLSAKFLLQKLKGFRLGSEQVEAIQLLPPQNLMGRPKIEIGPCSSEFGALCRRSSNISLKLTGVRATQHDQAIAELKSYADSLFFQIDTIYDTTFLLERQRRSRLAAATRRKSGFELSYPSGHYNGEAMSLYWYAKSARDMPLLRFLAFYQSIEFYFPRYSQTEARRRVSSILKQPTFRPHREDDVDRLISAIQSSRGGGLGSERAQLRAVVNECISADDMRDYLISTKDKEEHFSSKSSKYHKIPIVNKNADLRNDIADRIYDIRCKIVHTKNEHSEDDFPMILPFSEDADYLIHDIELAEFIARSVLVSASGELG